MTGSDPKTDLHRYLQDAREALLWKLDGLSEYNIRRPMVPTGTNLLGLIKHAASVELGYFGDCFGRPFSEPLPWLEDDAEPNADMWATADESREQITGLYRRAWAHSDATIGTLALDAIGHVPWWPDNRSEVTLHKILVHMIAETDRHAGQADIVRELIDGATGLRDGNDSMAPGDQAWWASYRSRLERVAREVGGRIPSHGTMNYEHLDDEAAMNDERENLSWQGFGEASRELAKVIAADGFEPDLILSIARGGLFLAGSLGYALAVKNLHVMNVEFYDGVGTTLDMPVMLPPVPSAVDFSAKKVLIADDVADSGRTIELVHTFIKDHVEDVRSAVIYEKPRSVIKCDYVWKRTDRWINFPWSCEGPVVERAGQVFDA